MVLGWGATGRAGGGLVRGNRSRERRVIPLPAHPTATPVRPRCDTNPKRPCGPSSGPFCGKPAHPAGRTLPYAVVPVICRCNPDTAPLQPYLVVVHVQRQQLHHADAQRLRVGGGKAGNESVESFTRANTSQYVAVQGATRVTMRA